MLRKCYNVTVLTPLLVTCQASVEPPGVREVPATVAQVSAAAPGRLIILGFDGVDPGRVERAIAAGRLPALRALGERGYRGEMATTNPPMSPVAWATLATGWLPGDHGVFDFVRRDPHSGRPQIATPRIEHAEVTGERVRPARVRNPRLGVAFWDVMARSGIAARALNVPYAYPPPSDGASALGGVGLPDACGTNSLFTLLTADGDADSVEAPPGGRIERLAAVGEGSWQGRLLGPRIRVDGEQRATEVPVTVRRAGAGLVIGLAGASATVAVGETSPYLEVAFVAAPALTVRAVTRVTVRRAGAKPEIYVEPLSIAPPDPYLPLSAPAALAESLWRTRGPFKTVGWVHDTSALDAGALGEAQFRREALATMRRRAAMTLDAIAEPQHRLVVSAFTATDRIAHLFYRYLDPAHPAPKDGDAAANARALADAHDLMDDIVGRVAKRLTAEDVLVVVSDHGFGSFRRGLNLNRWLLEAGYLALEPGVKRPRGRLADVDWSRTRAYALGTGSIYLNLAGREAHGIVTAKEAPALAGRIAAELNGLRDGEVTAVVGVYAGDRIFAGRERWHAPDLRVALADGYRVSWATSLGGIGETLFDDNRHRWSGDHASAAPAAVPAILVSNRAVSGAPRIEDLAATAYAFFGVTPPPGLTGRPWWNTAGAPRGP